MFFLVQEPPTRGALGNRRGCTLKSFSIDIILQPHTGSVGGLVTGKARNIPTFYMVFSRDEIGAWRTKKKGGGRERQRKERKKNGKERKTNKDL